MNDDYRQQMAQALRDATCGVCGSKASTLKVDPDTKVPIEGSGRCSRCLHKHIGRLLGLTSEETP